MLSTFKPILCLPELGCLTSICPFLNCSQKKLLDCFDAKDFIVYLCGDIKFPESSRTFCVRFLFPSLRWSPDSCSPLVSPGEELSKPPHPPHPHPNLFFGCLWLFSSKNASPLNMSGNCSTQGMALRGLTGVRLGQGAPNSAPVPTAQKHTVRVCLQRWPSAIPPNPACTWPHPSKRWNLVLHPLKLGCLI